MRYPAVSNTLLVIPATKASFVKVGRMASHADSVLTASLLMVRRNYGKFMKMIELIQFILKAIIIAYQILEGGGLLEVEA